jgi:hypothetical protein
LLYSSYIGGSGEEFAPSTHNLTLDGRERFFNRLHHLHGFSGDTDCHQTVLGGGTGDATLILLSAQFDRLLYCTYLGGVSDDHGRTGFIGKDGSLYISGQTNGGGWPVRNAFQNTYAGGDLDIILAKFVPPRN